MTDKKKITKVTMPVDGSLELSIPYETNMNGGHIFEIYDRSNGGDNHIITIGYTARGEYGKHTAVITTLSGQSMNIVSTRSFHGYIKTVTDKLIEQILSSRGRNANE